MSNVFDSVVPEEHYKSEMSRLSADIYELDEQVKKLKDTLIKLKVDITNVQFYGQEDYDLNSIIKRIEKALEEK